jgi:hypothetical protein
VATFFSDTINPDRPFDDHVDHRAADPPTEFEFKRAVSQLFNELFATLLTVQKSITVVGRIYAFATH